MAAPSGSAIAEEIGQPANVIGRGGRPRGLLVALILVNPRRGLVVVVVLLIAKWRRHPVSYTHLTLPTIYSV